LIYGGSKKENKNKSIKVIIIMTTTIGVGRTTLVYTRVFKLYGLYTQLKLDLIVDVADWLYPYITPAKLG